MPHSPAGGRPSPDVRQGGPMRKLLTVGLGVAGSMLCIAPAAAAPSEPVDPTPIVGDFCGFETSIVPSGKQR